MRGTSGTHLCACSLWQFKLPVNNRVLLSIGSYKMKNEFLPFARMLHQLDYKLFGSENTADFYSSECCT